MEWPITPGDYIVGEPNAPVAVVTLASDYKYWELKNYALCGTCFSENFGIEKIIVNVLANPNINSLIVCGEDSAHLPGQTLVALAENGVTNFGGFRKIVGSKAGLPYLNEIPMTSISRFLREIEILDLVGVTDPVVIQKTIDSRSPGVREESSVIPMPEIDEHSWKKYEKLVTRNVMSYIKK